MGIFRLIFVIEIFPKHGSNFHDFDLLVRVKLQISMLNEEMNWKAENKKTMKQTSKETSNIQILCTNTSWIFSERKKLMKIYLKEQKRKCVYFSK